MIVALVAVLGGGGYFMMKPKPAKAIKVVEMGATVDIKEEFLVNLADSSAYLRTEISLQMAKDFKGNAEEEMSPIRDAILNVLSQCAVDDMKSPEKIKKLRHDIAASVNKVLAEEDPKAKEEKTEEPKKGQAVVKEKKEVVDVPEDWDSAEGPVLKVLFRSRAWQ